MIVVSLFPLIIISIITIVLISFKSFLVIGVFFGLTWFPAKVIFIKEERDGLRYLINDSIEQAEHKTNTRVDRLVGTVVVLITSVLFNFLSTVLFWPGMIVTYILNMLTKKGNDNDC